MRTRRVIVFAFLLVLACFLVWWLWLRDEALVAGAKPAALTRPAAKVAPSTAPATKAPNPTVPGTSGRKPDLNAGQLQELMNNANRPISFFGKVIDQDDNPVPGVKVTLQIRYMKTVGPVGIGDTFAEPSLTTGADGRFALSGAKGSLLGLKALTKDGYEPSPKAFNGSYWYWRDKNPYQPDPDHPEIFRMWKKAGAEPLIRKGISAGLQYDGTPMTFDLLSGAKTQSGGDLRVALDRNPRQIVYGQRNYEWTLTIESLNGGMIESNDEQMYRAPADGYQPKLVVHMAADNPDWTDEKSVELYLKLRGGTMYGRAELKVLVGSDRATTPFYITAFLNTRGSRNLEYDSTQDVRNEPSRIKQ